MARIDKGILGPVSGTVGTVVGANWKGISYIRSKSTGKRGSTVEQIDQQLKFSLAVNFVSTMTGLLNQTFKSYADKKSQSNAALSYILLHAIAGKTPDYEIDFSKALVSRGDLSNATAPSVTETNKVLHFTWTDNSGLGNAAATDNVVLVAYCKNYNTTVYTIGTAVRSSAAAMLDVTNFSGYAAEIWIAFLNSDGSDASNSIFLGEITIS